MNTANLLEFLRELRVHDEAEYLPLLPAADALVAVVAAPGLVVAVSAGLVDLAAEYLGFQRRWVPCLVVPLVLWHHFWELCLYPAPHHASSSPRLCPVQTSPPSLVARRLQM